MYNFLYPKYVNQKITKTEKRIRNQTKHKNKKKTKKNRHETPVLAHPIKIIHLDNDLIVLDKPCSVPVSN